MRRRVLHALSEASEPVDAQSIAGLLGLHVTTARFHLDQLESAGLAVRRPSAQNGRGRPRVFYVVAGAARDEASREQLIGVLATALATREDVQRIAARAGRNWADAFLLRGDDNPTAALLEAFDQVGFGPELDGEHIVLHECPFREQARAHPEVVCSVHRGLIDQVLVRAGGDTTAQLLPFVQPNLCMVTLNG
jgi:predicted ArsR family transcriptional regulator